MKKKELLYATILLLLSSIVFNSCNMDNNKNPVNVIEEEEKQPIEISWQTKAPMPSSRYCGDAVVCNDKIYHIGGRLSNSIEKSNFEYDPIKDSWNAKAEMQKGTMNLALAAIGENIYAIGGDRFLSKNEIFNTISNTWTYGASMPTPRQHVDCGVVKGKIYVIGGLLSWDRFTGINEAYDPTTNTWETKAPMPTPRHNPAITVYKDKIYVFGGSGSTTDIWAFQNTVEAYDPATDTWISKQGLPTNRFKPATAVIDDKIYIIGGSVEGVISSRVDVYYPETDTWEDSTDAMELPKPILFAGVVTINNSIFVSGGCDSEWNAYSSNYQGILE